MSVFALPSATFLGFVRIQALKALEHGVACYFLRPLLLCIRSARQYLLHSRSLLHVLVACQAVACCMHQACLNLMSGTLAHLEHPHRSHILTSNNQSLTAKTMLPEIWRYLAASGHQGRAVCLQLVGMLHVAITMALIGCLWANNLTKIRSNFGSEL